MGQVSPAVEAKLSSMSEHLNRHEYRPAEKLTTSLATTDWMSTKDFIRPLKTLVNLGLVKSSQ